MQTPTRKGFQMWYNVSVREDKKISSTDRVLSFFRWENRRHTISIELRTEIEWSGKFAFTTTGAPLTRPPVTFVSLD